MAEYPHHLSRRRALVDGREVIVRPILPRDRSGARFPFDYKRSMAFVCEAAEGELAGEASYASDPGARTCRFKVEVTTPWRGTQVAGLLMEALIRAAQARGFEAMEGTIPHDDADTLKLARALGFEPAPASDGAASARLVRKL